MNLFFNTSTLVKFFHEEEGSEAVTNLILDRNNNVWVLELAQLEFKMPCSEGSGTEKLLKSSWNKYFLPLHVLVRNEYYQMNTCMYSYLTSIKHGQHYNTYEHSHRPATEL